MKIITRDCIDYPTRAKYLDIALKVKKHLTTGVDVSGKVGADGVISFSLSLGDRGNAQPGVSVPPQTPPPAAPQK